ncbi:hypothetical protein QBC41DRAFT_309911 [Cercophora samala]|uniref:Uncharacterized protein n=1 Tax=Cercophora samala TaxID=330535 RepID=A0AA39ZNA0_9PEZI|nr:hypothetical protein QBC41DRAFT_309911 [Cercophora samala]
MAATISKKPVFPRDIWLMVAEELAADCDFDTLYTCGRVDRNLAQLALPLLYSIHDQSPVIDAHVVGLEASVCLWRSIIASSLNETRYPYCCWIKSLKLGHLHFILDGLSRKNAVLKARFFQDPLQRFMINIRGQQLNLDRVVLEVVDSITRYIKSAAEQADKRVLLTTLEGHYFPPDCLVNWISSLPSLTSLVVRDGLVLTADVAKALHENCPSFKHLQCYSCEGPVADQQLAGFLRELKPQSLESFTVRSQNNLGSETFMALQHHSSSLQELRLLSLEPTALTSLHQLRHCLALVKLAIEGNHRVQRFDWFDSAHPDDFEEVAKWISKCASLRELSLLQVSDATELIGMLQHHDGSLFKLTSLTLVLNELKDFSFYSFIERQNTLERLTMTLLGEEFEYYEFEEDQVARTLRSLRKLKKLNTNAPLSTWDLAISIVPLEHLEELWLNGDLISDEYLVHLIRLKKLRSLAILGPSCLTAEGIHRFMRVLHEHQGECREAHRGLQISVLSQEWDAQLDQEVEYAIRAFIDEIFGGTFDITYQRHPDEMHESDFSD